jgi:uncharacterized protein (TIGR03435 family)
MKAPKLGGALFFLFLCWLPTLQAETGVQVGSPAPPLTLKKLLQAPDGIRGTWEELRGRAVVIEFWATWCGGCVDNIPHLNELVERFASRPIQFISITDETDVDLVKRFLEAHPIRGWIAFDEEAGTFKRYAMAGRPQTLLVDRSGNVRALTNPAKVTPQVLEDLLADKPLNIPQPESRSWPPLGLEPNAPPPLLQVLIRPAAPIEVSGTSPISGVEKNGRYDSYGQTLRVILSDAYEIPESRVDAPEWCSKTRYDFSFVTPQHGEDLRWPLVRQVLAGAFQLKLHEETKGTPVYVLRKIAGQEPKLRVATAPGKTGYWNPSKGEVESIGGSVSSIIRVTQFVLSDEVLDETGLTGRYDFNLKWDGREPKSIVVAIREQLGLELAIEHRALNHLVVDAIEEPKTW